jgi:hypothetical protein
MMTSFPLLNPFVHRQKWISRITPLEDCRFSAMESRNSCQSHTHRPKGSTDRRSLKPIQISRAFRIEKFEDKTPARICEVEDNTDYHSSTGPLEIPMGGKCMDTSSRRASAVDI